MITRLPLVSLLLMILTWAPGTVVTALRQQPANTGIAQSFTLYPPKDKATGKYDDTRACFSFKTGMNKQAESFDWDLGYGFARINHEDWLVLGSGQSEKRSVMKELGRYNWSDSFVVPALEPLPELKEGEERHIVVDASADTHKVWASSTTKFAKAKIGQMYVMRVKDDEADFYVLFRVEELEQEKLCTISWKRIPAPASSER